MKQYLPIFLKVFFVFMAGMTVHQRSIAQRENEICLEDGSVVKILNNGGDLNIRTWQEPKVKVLINGKDSALSRAELLRYGISIDSSKEGITVSVNRAKGVRWSVKSNPSALGKSFSVTTTQNGHRIATNTRIKIDTATALSGLEESLNSPDFKDRLRLAEANAGALNNRALELHMADSIIKLNHLKLDTIQKVLLVVGKKIRSKNDSIRLRLKGLDMQQNTELSDLHIYLDSLGGNMEKLRMLKLYHGKSLSDSLHNFRVDSVWVKAFSKGNDSTFSFDFQPSTVFPESGVGNGDVKKIEIIVPQHSFLKISNSFKDINIDNDIDSVAVNSSNGNLSFQNVKYMKVNMSFGKLSGENIGTAKINISNARLNLHNTVSINIASRFSDISLGKTGTLKLSSNNDDYDIQELDSLLGSKNFGNLRIGLLNDALRLSGSNSDLRIFKVSHKLGQLKIDNSFADIRIPVSEIKNYQLIINGLHNTVYSGNNAAQMQASGQSFTSGDGKKKFSIQCSNCTIDVK